MKKAFVLLLVFTNITIFVNAQWQPTNGPYGGDVSSFAIIGSNIFAGDYFNGVFLSTNNGSTWTAVNNGLTTTEVYALAVSGSNIFAGTGYGIFLSTNNGNSWTEINSGLTDFSVISLAISGSSVFAGTYGGVFLSSNNGGSWTPVNNGLTDSLVWSFAISGNNIFAGTESGVFLSGNNGSSWTAVNNGLPNFPYNFITALAANGTDIFAGTYGCLFLSSNNGSNWTQVYSFLTLDTSVTALAISGNNIFAGTSYSGAQGGGGVFLSTNNGSNWIAVNNGLTNASVNALAISGSTIFAGTNAGGVFKNDIDGGSRWSACNNGLLNSGVTALAASGSNIFAGIFGGGIFLSSDNGSTWTAINNGLTNAYVNALAISGSNIFAGTGDTFGDGNVFLSTNNGSTWTAMDSGLTKSSVNALAISGTNIGGFAGYNYCPGFGAGLLTSYNYDGSWYFLGIGGQDCQDNNYAIPATITSAVCSWNNLTYFGPYTETGSPTAYFDYYLTCSCDPTSYVISSCGCGNPPCYIDGATSPSNVPDNYNGCTTDKNGDNAYVGLTCYNSGYYNLYDEDKTLMYQQMNSTMTAGVTYLVSFWVQLASISDTAVNGFGVKFADWGHFWPITYFKDCQNLNGPNGMSGNLQYGVYIGPPVNGTGDNSWTQITGTYTSTLGTEQYIILGDLIWDTDANFQKEPNNNNEGCPMDQINESYYYFDDVSVIPEFSNVVITTPVCATPPSPTATYESTCAGISYTYLWSDGETGNPATGYLTAGTYSVVVMDAVTGNTSSVTFEMTSVGCRFAENLTAAQVTEEANMYPNPSTGNITVVYQLNSSGVLQLFDMVGKMVGEYQLDGRKNEFEFDMGDLCCGIFEYKVTDSEALVSEGRLVILR